MKVRVKQHASGDRWVVESLQGIPYFRAWSFEEYFYGDDARQRAIEYAKRLLNPEIIDMDSK